MPLGGAGLLGQAWGLSLCRAAPPIPDPSWVLLQMIRPGLGPPSPPLSGSSCPSTEQRSAAGRGRAADRRPRRPLVPTGGGTLPWRVRSGQGRAAPSLLVLTCAFLGPGCSPVRASLWVRLLLLGELGPCSLLYPRLSPPSVCTWYLGTPPQVLRHAGASPANRQPPLTWSWILQPFSGEDLEVGGGPFSPPTWASPLSLAPPVTMMTAGRRRRQRPQPLRPHSPLHQRRSPRR